MAAVLRACAPGVNLPVAPGARALGTVRTPSVELDAPVLHLTPMRVPPFGLSLEEIRAELAPLRHDLSIAVCRAKNPFNVGAIIRVAHSFLVREIFLIGTDPFYERASMGMHRYENLVELPDPAAFLQRVTPTGRPLLALERDCATTSLWEAEMPPGLIFVVGNEDDGVPREILDACRSVVAIPMYGINHSFPVAVAAGMALCEWARRRDPRGQGNAPAR